jgi:hypothetical protein
MSVESSASPGVPYDEIAEQMLRGRVVPFLGAGANRDARPAGVSWSPGASFLPDGTELARYLAARCNYPTPDESAIDLKRVAQYAALMEDEGTLYDNLRDVFDADYPISGVYDFLARVPPLLRAARKEQQVLISTNYDDLLERALAQAGEPFDTVWYQARPGSRDRGRLLHRPPDADACRAIDDPDQWGLDADGRPWLRDRPTILKLHGAVDRRDDERDSYVITEDDYIEYLAQADTRIPKVLLRQMRRAHFLFMGYSLRDWNMRVILSRILDQRELTRRWWSVQREVAEIDRALWERQARVQILDLALSEFIAGLDSAVQAQADHRSAAG